MKSNDRQSYRHILSSGGGACQPIVKKLHFLQLAGLTRLFLLLLVCFVGLLAGCQRAIEPSANPVSIQRVASGQTVEIVTVAAQTPTSQTVRLIGIDTPDLQQQPWGVEAKQQLEELLGTKSVRLEFDVERHDRYGRSLAYLWVGNQLANEQLVATGHALAMPRSPNVKYQEQLQRAQESARLMGKGIWNPDNPLRQTPTEFRHQNQSRLMDLGAGQHPALK
ncbi:MAG: thermonuclease family protein [Geitlerinemataceae cyanobacterium]